MQDIYFTDAILEVSYEKSSPTKYEVFKKDFDLLSEYDEDYIGEWVKLAKAKREVDESDEILLKLVVELHRKIDRLEQTLKNEETKKFELENIGNIVQVHYEYLKINTDLDVGETYYLKILMPVFPKREIPMFVEVAEKRVLKMKLLHNRDLKDWDSYVAAKQRSYIREKKAKGETSL